MKPMSFHDEIILRFNKGHLSEVIIDGEKLWMQSASRSTHIVGALRHFPLNGQLYIQSPSKFLAAWVAKAETTLIDTLPKGLIFSLTALHTCSERKLFNNS